MRTPISRRYCDTIAVRTPYSPAAASRKRQGGESCQHDQGEPASGYVRSTSSSSVAVRKNVCSGSMLQIASFAGSMERFGADRRGDDDGERPHRMLRERHQDFRARSLVEPRMALRAHHADNLRLRGAAKLPELDALADRLNAAR